MKKVPLLLIAIGLMFVSCGRSGWSCSKRYCDSSEASINKETSSNKKVNV